MKQDFGEEFKDRYLLPISIVLLILGLIEKAYVLLKFKHGFIFLFITSFVLIEFYLRHVQVSAKLSSIIQNNEIQNKTYRYSSKARKNSKWISIFLGVFFIFFLLGYLVEDHRYKAINIKLVSLSTEDNYQTIEVNNTLSFVPKVAASELVHNNKISDHPFFLDIKLRNIGDKTSFGKKIELNFKEIRIDPTPVLDYFVYSSHEGNNLCLVIKNYGWGEAKNVELLPFHNNIIKSLKIKSESDVQWKGQINEALILTLPSELIKDEFRLSKEEYNEVKYILNRWHRAYIPTVGPNLDEKDYAVRSKLKQFGKAFLYDDFVGGINYVDRSGKIYESDVYWCDHNPLFYDILLTTDGFELQTLKGVAARREPSYTYDLILNPDKIRPSNVIKIDISQEIKPNDTDRFFLKIKSEKSAYYKFDIIFVFDEDNKVVKYESIFLNTINPHKNNLEKYDLFVFEIDKNRWVKY